MGRFKQTIDLTSYNYLRVEFSLYDAATSAIGISTSSNITSYSSLSSKTTSSLKKGELVLNISSVSGSYFIYFYGGNNFANYFDKFTLTTV